MECLEARRYSRSIARSNWRLSMHRAPWAALLITLAFFAQGCAQITARDAHLKNAIRDHWERVQATSADLSETTCAVLAGNGLLEEALVDPECGARELEPRIRAQPNVEGTIALAELSYQTGLRHQTLDPFGAIAWYRDAATLASLAIADPTATQLAGAVRIHNQALTRLIRVAQSSMVRGGRSWRDVLIEYGFVIDGSSHFLDPARIADLRLTGDLRVTGMNHVYYTNGLGVPVVAHRIVDPAQSADVQDQFLPRELRAPATAVVVADGGFAGGQWR